MAFHTPLLHRMDALTTVLWRIYSFEIPLISGKVRRGLVFSLKDTDGNERWGEISPHECRNLESLELAFQQLVQFFDGTYQGELFPSVQFGLESALSPPIKQTTAPLYAFACGSKDEILAQADIAQQQGYETLKVKISNLSIREAAEVLHALKHRFRLRVDCSSKFTVDDANTFFSEFDKELFDYIEDPS